jgi:hypothetical protein
MRFYRGPVDARYRRDAAVRERIDEGRQIHEKPKFKLKRRLFSFRPGGGACGKPSA